MLLAPINRKRGLQTIEKPDTPTTGEMLTQLSKKGDIPLEARVLKLVEEVGELSRAVLIRRGFKHADGNEDDAQAMLEEEVVDVYMLVHSLMCDLFGDVNSPRIVEILERKLVKWKEKFK